MANLDPAFIQKFYREATELLHTSRHYMLHQGKFEMDTLSKAHGEYIEQEMARVATRMCGIVSWLMEIRSSGTKVNLHLNPSDPWLEEDHVCMEDSTVCALHPLPENLVKLLHESRNLYLRLTRLEDLLRSNHKKSVRP